MNDTTLKQIAAVKAMVNKGNHVWTWNHIWDPPEVPHSLQLQRFSWLDCRHLHGFHLSMRETRAVCSADARMRVLKAPVQNAGLFEVLLCLPTAPALPIEGNGDFGTSPIYGQLPDKRLLI